MLLGGKLMRLRFLLIAAVLATMVSANAEQVLFTGHTRANDTLIHDIMKYVALIGKARSQCDSPNAVETEICRTTSRPQLTSRQQAGQMFDTSVGRSLSCGRVEPFIIGYWPAPDGGMRFLVSQGESSSKGLGAVLVIESPEIHSVRVAAEKGDPAAQYELGAVYQQGRDVPKDYAQAAEWYSKAAAAGHAAATARLGELYEYGAGVERDVSKAVEWIQSRRRWRSGRTIGFGDSLCERQRRAARLYASDGVVPEIRGARQCKGAIRYRCAVHARLWRRAGLHISDAVVPEISRCGRSARAVRSRRSRIRRVGA